MSEKHPRGQHQPYPQYQPYPPYQPQGQPPQPGAQAPYPYPVQPPQKRRHVFRWFFIAVQVIFLIWIIAGAHAGHTSTTDCGTLSVADCQSAKDAGTAIGVGIIIAFWIGIDIVLGIIRICVLLGRRK